MSYLDTLLILGAPFPSLEPLIKFVEPHASSTRVLRNMVCFEGTEGRDYYVKDWKNGGEIITEKGMGGRIVGAEGRGIREGDIGKEVRKHVKAYSLIANYKIIQCTNLRRRRSLSSDRFASLATQEIENDTPTLMKNYADNYPGCKKLRDLTYLIIDYGHRTLPIELGSLNTSKRLNESLMSVVDFVDTYLSKSTKFGVWSYEEARAREGEVAYCAQHGVFEQIKGLRDLVEDWPTAILGGKEEKPGARVNAWIGTGGTRTPLHFDSYDNIFVQVVGVKYVRIYRKTVDVERIYLKKGEGAGKQGNMSKVDVEDVDEIKFPGFKDLEYEECLMFPGDALYIPVGTWHYVRSLTTSVSVSYWF
ncbi:hypothetical protein TL16_g02554 [Triparma laevis f. inornata]|uniref:JmjC domain-containing protein n=1 Tax=Triparma laevis f. inornata TaxID=1714386 RepID=A0A9W6ZW38_9STRA|nr:hypothetical protein TL16_g02554 [Triparma laevis f. inornata]